MEEASSIKDFRVQLGLKCMDIAKILSFSNDQKKAEENLKAEKCDDTYYIGSPISLSQALCEKFSNKKWHDLVSGKGDAKIICHDKTMLIADVLQYCSLLSDVSKLLKFWTFTRVRDLQQGWHKSLFACSYKLTFKDQKSKGVYVDVYGNRHMNSYVYQERVDQKMSVSYITPVKSTHVVEIKVSTEDDKQKLNKTLTSMVICLRKFPEQLLSSSKDNKPMGEVRVYFVEFEKISEPSFKICFDSCEFVGAKRISTSSTDSVPVGEDKPSPTFSSSTEETSINADDGIITVNQMTIARARSIILRNCS